MADQYLQRLGVPPQFINIGSPSVSAFALDANTDGIAFVCSAPTTDAITHIGWRYGTRTGTPPTYITGFEGISSGNPDGTYLTNGGNCSGTFTPPADTTWDNLFQWIALDNSYSPATLGEYLCGTVRYSSGTINASNFSSFANELGSVAASSSNHYPYSLRTTGSWSKRTSLPIFGLRTASNRYGLYWSGHYATNVTTSGHRSAMKFRIESSTTNTFKLAGFKAWSVIGSGTGQSPKACLWSASSELASTTLSTTNDISSSTRCLREFLFSSQPTLNAGTDYYVGFEVVTSGAVSVSGFQLADAADRAAFPGGTNWHLSTYNGSVWSDDTTVRPQVELIPADMTQASGGSGAIIIPGGMGQFGVAVH